MNSNVLMSQIYVSNIDIYIPICIYRFAVRNILKQPFDSSFVAHRLVGIHFGILISYPICVFFLAKEATDQGKGLLYGVK